MRSVCDMATHALCRSLMHRDSLPTVGPRDAICRIAKTCHAAAEYRGCERSKYMRTGQRGR